MHYLLFIPDATTGPKPAQKALEDLGLGDFVGGHEGMHKQGPEGKLGQLVCWRKPGKNEPFHFNESEQTWIPAVANGENGEGKGRYYVGFWNDSPVTPEDLRRPYAHPGSPIQLGDGNLWRYPALASLPRDLILADDGTWQFELQRQYQDIWFDAVEWNRRLTESPTHKFGEIADFCLKCLKQNYRLLPEVASHLRLFSSANLETALLTVLGWEVPDVE